MRRGKVLINLVGNAVKFTEEGGITVEAKELKKEGENLMVEFTVTDTGIGIPEDKLESVFESFSQASSDTTRKYGGTGLGLSISKQLVEIHGGEMFITSKLGVGTTFGFRIPYKAGTGENQAIKTVYSPEKHELKNLKILLVEDNNFNQMVAIDTLEASIPGVKIEVAENGQQAVEKVQAHDFDLVLMDVQMPVMDGYTATKNIRGMGGTKGATKIMAMTASATTEEIERCYAAGMDQFISKPFDHDDLMGKIAQLIFGTKDGMEKATGGVHKSLEGIKVLLVEDNDFNQIVATDTLESLIKGIKIEVAENGQVAVNKVQNGNYDLVLMDVNMPVMNGYDATDQIRNVLNSDVPIMAMTANATQSEIQACLTAGMDEFITKPFDPQELLKKMSSVIQKKTVAK
ncbi:MAG: response regulator [Bacteroidetes bacterium]|nr:response regulator [Bacteroidota bacterium]